MLYVRQSLSNIQYIVQGLDVMIKLELTRLSILPAHVCPFEQTPIYYKFCEDIIHVIVNYEGIADSSAIITKRKK